MSKLTIFITNSKSGAFFEIATGWKNAFAANGHKAILWDGNISTWQAHKPDIYIGCSGWRQKLPPSHKAQVAIHVNPFCDSIIQAPGGPVINEKQDAIKWTISQRPKFVFGYGLQDDMGQWWYRWKKDHNIEMVGMPNAADATKYRPGPPDQNLICDVGWVGGYWPYKAINLDKYIVPVARKYKTIWYGWSGPKDLWRGSATQDQISALFRSAKICPCVAEPHTTIYGIDIPERLFKVAASGALAISDPIHGLDRFFSKDILPTASDPAHYMQLCDMYINMDPNQRKTQAMMLTKEVLKHHTYYNRVQTLLQSFGYYNEADEYDLLIARATTLAN
jgi:hypothetical protein